MKKTAIASIIICLLFAVRSTPVTVVQTASKTRPNISASQIPQIRCGDNLGTAIYVGKKMTTAEHVTTGYQVCQLRNDPNPVTGLVRVNDHNTEHDLSMLRRPFLAPNGIDLSCERLVEGNPYWAVGYPEGSSAIQITRVVAEGTYYTTAPAPGSSRLHTHQRSVVGSLKHGMSGGPIIDADGRVVAFISGFMTSDNNIGLVKEFADTKVCDQSDK